MAENLILEETSRAFAYSSTFGAYASSDLNPSYSLEAGQEYKVIWDGVEHTRTAFAFVNNGFECVGVGNPIAAGQADNGDLFCIGYNITHDIIYYLSLEQTESHTVAIYQIVEEEAFFMVKKSSMKLVADSIRAKAGIEGKLEFPNGFKTAIEGITAGSGGGSYEDVRYVTFMSEDGTVELGKKPVAVGDDCADPIARGIFDTPTKESTAQYNYTFYGWAMEVNGAYDSDALKSVTEDRTVYANYISAVRYYTITYYDGDTVLKTESLAYGSTPSYAPMKDGYKFNGWEPELVTVVGDATYYAQFVKQVTFQTGSWADIAAVCESGEAATAFALGDTRTITLTYADGTTENVDLQIVGFGEDTLEDGTAAGISILAKNVLKDKRTEECSDDQYTWNTLGLRTWMNSDLLSALPAELQQVIKPTKIYEGFKLTYDKCWAPCYLNIVGSQSNCYGCISCKLYTGISEGKVKKTATLYGNTTNVSYHTRSGFISRSGNSMGMAHVVENATGVRGSKNTSDYIRFGFCI